ncbi:hypothetical protein HYDPIDRAFT_118989 [Hydnomerulius pinastri MD-312]|uniref:Uncharacterized protein n=1 Tax=Hydnomerulius pinastri MD-312 TaxID=994086 RepID=A0A0C9W7Q5_9AGAM|nr:hypothetical protein HYDPIDRAFT_118989 [Hydnomerulius pinastri MD-312]
MHSFNLCPPVTTMMEPRDRRPNHRLTAKSQRPSALVLVSGKNSCVDSRGNCFIRCVWRQEASE